MFQRLYDSIMNKITLLVGRGIVLAINNSEGTQKITARFLAGEVLKEIERLEDYGFTSYPPDGSEVAAVFLGGHRQHGVILKAHDRRYRPTDLSQNESAIYTSEDSSGSGHRVHMKADRSIDIKADVIDETADSDKIESIGNDLTINVGNDSVITVSGISTENITGSKTINAASVSIVSSSITLGGPGAAALLNETAIAVINGHTHPEHDGGNTGAPNQSLSVGANCTSVTKAL